MAKNVGAPRKSGTLYHVSGITRSGKGKWVIEKIKQKKAALVWDLKADQTEYPCNWRARNIPALKAALLKDNPGIICYSGKVEDLEIFCILALLFAEKFGGDGAVVIDETSDIAGTGKAIGKYGELLRTGLNRGADIYAMCQRPVESDKTSFGNASVFHFSTQGTPDDCIKMSKHLGIPIDVVSGLVFDKNKSIFECIDCERGHWYQISRLQFRNNKAVFVPVTEKKPLLNRKN